MSEAEFLFSVALVAATFAGFATLVVVIRQGPDRPNNALIARRLVTMLQQSLITILFCFIPFLPQYADLSPLSSWRLSSSLFCIAWLIHYVHNVNRLRKEGLLRQLSPSNRWHVYLVHPMAIAALALGSFGVWGRQGGLVYLCCALTMLYLCGFLFLQQVRALNIESAKDT